MDYRTTVKAEAKRLNTMNVNLAETIEENFPNAVVRMDVLSETDVNGNSLMELDEFGEPMFSTEQDFFIIESGSYIPNTQGGDCYAVETTTITYVSTERPDMIEDTLTLLAIGKGLRFILQTLDKQIQPLGNTQTDLTVVRATFTRPIKMR